MLEASSSPPSGRSPDEVKLLLVRRRKRPCHTYRDGRLTVCLPRVPSGPGELVKALSCRRDNRGSILWFLVALLASLAQAASSKAAAIILVLTVAILIIAELLVEGRPKRGSERGLQCASRAYPDWVVEALRRTHGLLLMCGGRGNCRGELEVAGRRVEYWTMSGLQRRLLGYLIAFRLLEDHT